MAQVRREVKAVTTRSPLLRREMIIHPLAPRSLQPAAPLRDPSDVERTFPLKDVTGFIARANYEMRIARVTNAKGGLSVGTFKCNSATLTRLRLTKNGWRVPMEIGPDNYRSVIYIYRAFNGS